MEKQNCSYFGHALSQRIRARWKRRIIGDETPIGINCPPVEKITLRAFKIFFRNNYKLYLYQVKYVKLTLMQESAFCPL
tara:strand:+ start:243 stop:479 length:237 start_codon:yes stop_codon:yes gene_type:complete